MKIQPARHLPDLLPAGLAMGLQAGAAAVEGVPLPPAVLLLSAVGAYCVYAADHASGTARLSDLRWKPAYTRVAVATLLLIAVAFTRTGIRLPVVGGYVGLSILYVVPLRKGARRLQDFPRIRMAAISAGWALIPFLNLHISGTPAEWGWMAGMAALLVPTLLLSDWKDREEDLRHQRPTWSASRTARWVTARCLWLLGVSALLFAMSPSTQLMTAGPLFFALSLSLRGVDATAPVADLFLLWAWVPGLAPELLEMLRTVFLK